jgi:Pol polyprotein
VNPNDITPATAFTASTQPNQLKVFCANCKKDNHYTNFCISPGEKMEGWTLQEAMQAFWDWVSKYNKTNTRGTTTMSNTSTPPQRLGTPKPLVHIADTSTPSLDNNNQMNNTSASQTMYINNILYIMDPTYTITNPEGTQVDNTFQYRKNIAWPAKHELRDAPSPQVYMFSKNPFPTSDLPFLLDTGVACHISPIKSDFEKLDYITPQPIKGLGNASISAIGSGIISLQLQSGTIMLNNAFYVPLSSV